MSWKETHAGTAARTRVRVYFTNCLELLEAEREEQARSRLRPFRWREQCDLWPAPFETVMQTERLCVTACLGDRNEMAGVLEQILELW